VTLSKVDITIFKLLLNHESLSLEKIQFFLKVSIVTARNSLKNLNLFLKKYNFGEILKLKKEYSLILTTDSFNDLEQDFEVTLSSEERISYITILLIFEKKINLNSLTTVLNVSRNTLKNDLTQIKKFLKKFNINLKSISWQGIILQGGFNDIKAFSINYLIKILIKKEFNELIWILYGKFLNPLIKNYFDKFISKEVFSQIKAIQENIIKTFNFQLGVYDYKKIECILIYHTIFKEDILNSFYLNLNNLDEILKNDYEEIFFNLKKLNIFQGDDKLLQSLSMSILTITEEYIFSHYKDITTPISNRVQEIYSVTLNKKELSLLAEILSTAYFKYDFNIISYLNYFVTNYDIPKSVITDIKYTLKKKKIVLLEEDYYILAIYLYDTICTRYKNLKIDMNFLIIDSSFKNWLGQELKKEFLKHLSFLTIDIISIFNHPILDDSFVEKYDYILFTNYVDKKNLLDKHPNFKDKVYYIKYNDFFEVNNLWGQLFFGPGGEASLPFIKRKLKKNLE
jgi:hypothetical protein